MCATNVVQNGFLATFGVLEMINKENGKQEGILLSKEEVEDCNGFTTIRVSWERIK